MRDDCEAGSPVTSLVDDILPTFSDMLLHSGLRTSRNDTLEGSKPETVQCR